MLLFKLVRASRQLLFIWCLSNYFFESEQKRRMGDFFNTNVWFILSGQRFGILNQTLAKKIMIQFVEARRSVFIPHWLQFWTLTDFFHNMKIEQQQKNLLINAVGCGNEITTGTLHYPNWQSKSDLAFMHQRNPQNGLIIQSEVGSKKCEGMSNCTDEVDYGGVCKSQKTMKTENVDNWLL